MSTAANLLWAHLLRKDATTTDTPSQIPPIAPQDKTGTTMRMLIHDTQVNLEKFSARLDGLLQRVDDCRAQVVNANKLLDVERDKVLAEILEIANRCQLEMKAHVGAPAQATALDLVRVSQDSTDKSVQALEKRIYALQALLQTHAHAMQSIQDQQNVLMGAILPLVPILHGVPPQMDQIKAALSDMVANAVSTVTSSVESVRSTLVAELAHGHGQVRSSTWVGPSNRSMSSLRCKRSNASVPGPQEFSVPLFSPLDNRSHGGPHKRARIGGAMRHAGIAQLPQRLSRIGVPATNSSDLPPVLQTPRTPRQPLADLHLPPGNNTPRVQRYMTRHMNSTLREHMRSLETPRAAGGPSTIPVPPSRPLFRPVEDARPDLQDAIVTRRHSAVLHDMSVTADKSAMGAVGPSDQDDLSKAIKIEELLEPNLSGVFSIHSSPLSAPPSSVGLAMQENVAPRHMADTAQVDLDLVPPSLSDPITSNPEVSPPKSMSLRDRRAQISRFGRTETRRFIRLGPWSDEEE